MSDTTTKCLNPNCNKPAKHRGLCVSCYQAARSLVAAGKVTWSALEGSGKVLAIKHSAVKTWLLS